VVYTYCHYSILLKHIADGYVKDPRSRLANPEKRGVLIVRRSNEG